MNREFSSGGVVYKQSLASQGPGRKTKDEVLWLVRRTASSKLFPDTYWMLPKGWLDDAGEGVPGPMAKGLIKADEKTLESTAIREVAEETGANAEIVEKIETVKYVYTHPKRGKTLKFVTFYLMRWKSNLPEGFDGETSEIAWLPFKEALKTLSFSREKEVLSGAYKLLL